MTQVPVEENRDLAGSGGGLDLPIEQLQAYREHE
jgi:hypothetical protein